MEGIIRRLGFKKVLKAKVLINNKLQQYSETL